MLWACFSSKGPGNLVRVHGIMNLNQDMVESTYGGLCPKAEDDPSTHVTKSTQKCFTRHKIKLLPNTISVPGTVE